MNKLFQASFFHSALAIDTSITHLYVKMVTSPVDRQFHDVVISHNCVGWRSIVYHLIHKINLTVWFDDFINNSIVSHKPYFTVSAITFVEIQTKWNETRNWLFFALCHFFRVCRTLKKVQQDNFSTKMTSRTVCVCVTNKVCIYYGSSIEHAKFARQMSNKLYISTVVWQHIWINNMQFKQWPAFCIDCVCVCGLVQEDNVAIKR